MQFHGCLLATFEVCISGTGLLDKFTSDVSTLTTLPKSCNSVGDSLWIEPTTTSVVATAAAPTHLNYKPTSQTLLYPDGPASHTAQGSCLLNPQPCCCSSGRTADRTQPGCAADQSMVVSLGMIVWQTFGKPLRPHQIHQHSKGTMKMSELKSHTIMADWDWKNVAFFHHIFFGIFHKPQKHGHENGFNSKTSTVHIKRDNITQSHTQIGRLQDWLFFYFVSNKYTPFLLLFKAEQTFFLTNDHRTL